MSTYKSKLTNPQRAADKEFQKAVNEREQAFHDHCKVLGFKNAKRYGIDTNGLSITYDWYSQVNFGWMVGDKHYQQCIKVAKFLKMTRPDIDTFSEEIARCDNYVEEIITQREEIQEMITGAQSGSRKALGDMLKDLTA